MINENNPLICPECGSFYFKCFSCGYVYCGCEGNKDNCPECDSTDIGFADLDDVGNTFFNEEEFIEDEDFEDIDEDN